jgi:uncharacterized membrane protein YphA (DoxX/SURF4 family)
MTVALAFVLRLGLGGLLVVAGALKLRAPVAFATEIANYQLVPAVAPYVAAILPVLELVVGVALVLGPRAWRRAAALASLGMLAAFTIAVASAYFRRINIDCGCFGTGGGPITGLTLVRNAVLMLSAALIIAAERD